MYSVWLKSGSDQNTGFAILVITEAEASQQKIADPAPPY